MADKLGTMKDLLLHELNDLYSAEQQLIEALPKLAEAAKSPKLAQAIQDHFTVTQAQLKRLDQCFEQLGEQPEYHVCAAMKGLITEGNKLITQTKTTMSDPAVFDAALIAACQRVEHYEIAGYGCARTFAMHLGESNVQELLQQTLNEEGETDKALTQLAESDINLKADQAGAAGA
jgi:ferritin-like metal-binding protein YciE